MLFAMVSEKGAKSPSPSRYLVIGTGSIARRHIKNLKKLHTQADVACVSASGRLVTQEEVGSDLVFESLDAALLWRPHFAVVASPAPYHLLHGAQAIAMDTPVLIEKPLSHSMEEVAVYEAIFSATDVPVEIAYNLRYLPSAQLIKDVLDSNKLGKIHSVLVDVGQYLPDWRPTADYRLGVSARRELGGGVLLELSHELDYLSWFFGEFSQVFCVARKSSDLQIDVEDCVDAILKRRDGLVVSMHLDFLQRTVSRKCKIIGNEGSLVWDVVRNEVVFLPPGSEAETLYANPDFDRNEMYLQEIDRFSRVVAGEISPTVSFGQAMMVMNLIEGLNKSSQTGEAITLASEKS